MATYTLSFSLCVGPCHVYFFLLPLFLQNGRIPCDADIERLTLNEGYINGTHHVSTFQIALIQGYCVCNLHLNFTLKCIQMYAVQDGAWSGGAGDVHGGGTTPADATYCVCGDQ